jgi:hypothetical protein
MSYCVIQQLFRVTATAAKERPDISMFVLFPAIYAV